MEDKLQVRLQADDRLQLQLAQPLAGTRDYERLVNRPRINGVELTGDKTAGDLMIVSENTAAGWNENREYIPRRGEICVYTDHAIVQDDQGHDIAVPGIKIGDGSAYLIDLPFVGDDARYYILRELRAHAEDTAIHVTPREKAFWNNKLNYDVVDEELILNRE